MKRPGGIVRLRAVVPHENAAVAAVTIERTAECPDRHRQCDRVSPASAINRLGWNVKANEDRIPATKHRPPS